MELPPSLRTKLSVMRERMEKKGRAVRTSGRYVTGSWCGPRDRVRSCSQTVATAALLYVLIDAWVSHESDSNATSRPTACCVGPSTLARFVASARTRVPWATLRDVAAHPSGRSLPLLPLFRERNRLWHECSLSPVAKVTVDEVVQESS